MREISTIPAYSQNTMIEPSQQSGRKKSAGGQLFDIFTELKYRQASGHLTIQNSDNTQYHFYFYLGRLFYADGGCYPVRRWQRSLRAYGVSIAAKDWFQVSHNPIAESAVPSRYELISRWLKSGRLTPIQASGLIKSITLEMLFALHSSSKIAPMFQANKLTLKFAPIVLDPQQLVTLSIKRWQIWNSAGLSKISPTQAPILSQPEILRQQTSTQTFDNLSALLDGTQSIYDLGIRVGQNPVLLTRSLLPYLKSQAIKLVNLQEFRPPNPVGPSVQVTSPPNSPTARPAHPRKTVACIDDSPAVCLLLEKILTQAGYRVVTTTDPLRAITMLLEKRPDLILLDLVLPETNGYELCASLRKLTAFRTTPISILTGHAGLIDRVRSRLVGCNELLTKPINTEQLLEAIARHLAQSAEATS